jgi:hypothetical protein
VSADRWRGSCSLLSTGCLPLSSRACGDRGGQGGRGSDCGGPSLPLNFHFWSSVPHTGHGLCLSVLALGGSNSLFLPPHVKTTSPWASSHTQPSEGPSLSASMLRCAHGVARPGVHAQKPAMAHQGLRHSVQSMAQGSRPTAGFTNPGLPTLRGDVWLWGPEHGFNASSSPH